MDEKKYRIYAFLCAMACCAVALYSFRVMFMYLADVFSAEYDDMSYAWFVPPFSLWLLWLKRGALKREAAEGLPSAAGLALLAPCLFLVWLGRRGLQIRFEQVGFIGMCIAVPMAVYGKRAARLFAASAMFLVFTIPLDNYLGSITVPLRLLAVGAAEKVLSGIGMEVVRTGTVLVAQKGFAIDIVDGCSGLRSLFALATLTAAYAWMCQPTLLRRAILFLFSVPVAVAGNVARIVSICLAGRWFDREFAVGFYHDYSGYVVFAVAILMVVGISDAISRISAAFARRRRKGGAKDAASDAARSSSAPEPAETAPSARPEMSAPRRAIPLAAFVMCTTVFGALESLPPPEYRPVSGFSLPDIPGYVADIPLYCQNEHCTGRRAHSRAELVSAGKSCLKCPDCGARLLNRSPGELKILPKDTRMEKRIYYSADERITVSSVYGGESKGSIHRPELCLPAQGFLMTEPFDMTVDGIPFRVMTVRLGKSPPSTFAYTFFNHEGYRTSSHMARIWRDVCDRTFRGMLDGWAMVSVIAGAPGGFEAARDPGARARLEAFLRKLAPSLGAKTGGGE